MAPADQFWARVSPEPNSGCWLWDGNISAMGYGRFWLDGKAVSAHRFSWELRNGPIPAGLEVHHKVCQMKCCVNPEHLAPLTPREHLQEPDGMLGMYRANGMCLRGHAMTPENTRHDQKRKYTYCAQCRALVNKARRVLKQSAETIRRH